MVFLQRAHVYALLVVLAPLSAGCLGGFAAEAPDARAADAGPGRDGSGAPVTPARSGPAPEPASEEENLSKSRRWHFHNYWGESPNLTLFEGPVAFELKPESGHYLATFRPDSGRIVPPEAGRIDVRVAWNETASPVTLNLSYRSAEAIDHRWHGPVPNGENATIRVAENMTDVPHADASGWMFSLRAEAPGGLPAAPPEAAHVTVVASLGRPIYIDPPHEDRWNGTRTQRIAAWEGRVDTTVRAGDHTGRVQDDGPALGGDAIAYVVPSAQVPEGTQSVLVRLTWASDAPEATGSLALRFFEAGTGATGVPEPSGAGNGLREYRIPVSPPMTDNPYSNRTAWRFDVLLEEDLAAFRGGLRVDAWASRDAPNQALIPEPGS